MLLQHERLQLVPHVGRGLTADIEVTFDKINAFLGKNRANLMALIV